MPRLCCVEGCKTNLKREREQQTHIIPTFRFPHDDELRRVWLRNVGKNTNLKPKEWEAVCLFHFNPDDVVMYHESKDGSTFVPLKRARLRPGAFPTVFPGQPHAIFNTMENEVSTSDTDAAVVNNLTKGLKTTRVMADVIQSYEKLLQGYHTKVDTTNYLTLTNEDSVIFYTVEKSETLGCKINTRIKIDREMIVTVIVHDRILSLKELAWVLPCTLKLATWSQLTEILSRYRQTENLASDDFSTNCLKARDFIECALQQVDEDYEHYGLLELLKNQMELIACNTKRYHKSTLYAAFVIFSQHAATYKVLRNYLILPTPRHLQQKTASLNISPATDESNNNYINQVTKNLNERERKMILLIDEIYVKEKVDYKAGRMIGFTQSSKTVVAKTALAIMLKSPFGHFEEVIRLIPCKQLTGWELQEIILETITNVQKVNGIEIFAVITDGNAVNVNAFQQLKSPDQDADDAHFPNPSYTDKKIFTLYDPVHIFKNVRNNWINQEDRKLFHYPDFDDFSTKTASFCDLRDLYERESNSVVRNAHKLNFKTLNPNRLERQNVSLVCNVFDESTIMALKQFPEYEETANMMEIFFKWWAIMNTKRSFKDVRSLIPYFKRIESPNDDNIAFLKRFLDWLDIWHSTLPQDKKNKLTKETYKAMHTTTKALLEIVEYSLANFPISYILPGKFQTDDLEHRFGRYRYLSGCQYNVSMTSILEVEKKLRIRHLLAENIPFSDFQAQEVVDPSADELTEDFQEIFESDYLIDVSPDLVEQHLVCGYAADSVQSRITCADCTKFFVASKGGLTATDSYFNSRQRGGLVVPTSYALQAFCHMGAIFGKIIEDDILYNRFMSSQNCKKVLINLTIQSLQKDGVDFSECTTCGRDSKVIYKMLCSPLTNIVLKNHVNNINSEIPVHQDFYSRKLSTLA